MTILLIGMHRSGTSAITRLIGDMGAYIGNDLLEASPDNPHGFWERNDVLAINRAILKSQNCNWFTVERFDSSRPLPAELHAPMQAIADELSAHAPFVVKDPRFCLTLPYWLSYLSPHRGEIERGALAAHTYPLASTLTFARTLRKEMTNAERKLWQNLRREQLGVKFRKQHPVGNYIADFACLEKKIIIELDGGQHNEERAMIHDQTRTTFLNSQGYEVLRFWNNDVLDNIDGVMETIKQQLGKPAPSLTLPLRGRELVIVFANRDPAAIADSLLRRNQIPPVQGHALWEKYMEHARDNTRSLTVIACQFEELLATPAQTADALHTALSEHVPNLSKCDGSSIYS